MKLPTLLLAAFALAPAPAAAQFFWQPPDFSGAPVEPGEAGIGVALPGATQEELRANIAWQMRAALNVAALQCQFDRTLLSQNAYNGVLTNHREELARSYSTLSNYFKRTSRTPKEGQNALDRYGTKTYISVSTVQGILGFCQTASRIGRQASFVPRGGFTIFAIERLRELRNSLIGAGEQQFRGVSINARLPLPSFADKCWKRDRYKAVCGYTYS